MLKIETRKNIGLIPNATGKNSFKKGFTETTVLYKTAR